MTDAKIESQELELNEKINDSERRSQAFA